MDDFYNLVNKKWLNETTIPEDRQRWCAFSELDELNKNRIKKIILNNNQMKILYDQVFNYDLRNNKASLSIIYNILKTVDNIKTHHDLIKYIIELQVIINLNCIININISPSPNNSSINILELYPDNLHLGDKDYYINGKYITEFKEFIKQYQKLFGFEYDIYSIEKELANYVLSNVEKRNPQLTNNIMNIQDFNKRYQHININYFFELLDIEPQDINVNNLLYFEFLNNDILNVDKYKSLLKYRIICYFNNYLGEQTNDIYINFFDKILNGIKCKKTYEKNAIDVVDNFFGEIIGQEYCKKYYSNKSQLIISNMINHLKNTLRNKLNNCWMENETKEKAILKLDKMNFKIGCPTKLKYNYDNLNISINNSLVENILIILKFINSYELEQLYKSVDKDRWYINAHNINAYYSPYNNEIVFPAGILQKPFFSDKYDLAFNYGGIGSIIGHEIIHGFDDHGSQYDANGNLNNWWSANDKKTYENKIKVIRELYNNFGLNGDLTLGENIADIGGVMLSIEAMITDIGNSKEDKLKFFINYGRIWRSKIRDEYLERMKQIDPHSPPYYRVKGVIYNNKYFIGASGDIDILKKIE